MSERDEQSIADQSPPSPDRRSRTDRRRGGDSSSRRGRRLPAAWKRLTALVGRDIIIVVGAVAAIIAGVWATRPIFANSPTVVSSLTTGTAGSFIAKAMLDTTATDTSQRGQIVKSAAFERDRKAFAQDLVATGHMDPQRADSVAYYAVRESYLRGIPPAVVFGVMLTENSRFISTAMSNVGAVGLMQIYPKIWLKALQDKLGRDLASDSTNLKYGVYILSTYIKTKNGKAAPEAVKKGLLKYNGCVHGTNTPRCHSYPSKVANYVEEQGSSICSGRPFYECIAKQFIAGFTGNRAAVNQTPAPQRP
jgi:hypothetical protein